MAATLQDLCALDAIERLPSRMFFGNEMMKECVWLRPEAVAQIEFLGWTEAEKAASDYTRSSKTT